MPFLPNKKEKNQGYDTGKKGNINVDERKIKH
jgi:hypothetical protein